MFTVLPCPAFYISETEHGNQGRAELCSWEGQGRESPGARTGGKGLAWGAQLLSRTSALPWGSENQDFLAPPPGSLL